MSRIIRIAPNGTRTEESLDRWAGRHGRSSADQPLPGYGVPRPDLDALLGDEVIDSDDPATDAAAVGANARAIIERAMVESVRAETDRQFAAWFNGRGVWPPVEGRAFVRLITDDPVYRSGEYAPFIPGRVYPVHGPEVSPEMAAERERAREEARRAADLEEMAAIEAIGRRYGNTVTACTDPTLELVARFHGPDGGRYPNCEGCVESETCCPPDWPCSTFRMIEASVNPDAPERAAERAELDVDAIAAEDPTYTYAEIDEFAGDESFEIVDLDDESEVGLDEPVEPCPHEGECAPDCAWCAANCDDLSHAEG